MYAQTHASPDGFGAFLAAIQARLSAEHRDSVLARRLKELRPMPVFRLARLDGDTVSSASLRDRVVVVNFWGTWCGPGLAELPQIQKVYDRYRDDGFAGRSNVQSFPTTWFVDRQGRIAFDVRGGSDSDALLEEYVWRIESLRGRRGDGDPGAR